MKRKIIFAAIILASLLLFTNITNAESEKIDKFYFYLATNDDGSVSAEEIIEYNFTSNLRNGIIRNIQIIFKDLNGKKYETPLRLRKIVDESGKPWPYTTGKSNENYFIKIGDTNKQVTGKNTYEISYDADGAIEELSDYDKISWNITGNNWNVPIDIVNAIIAVPRSIPNNNINYICYTEIHNIKNQDCAGRLTEDNRLYFSTTRQLAPNENFIVSVTFPKGNIPILPKKEVPSLFYTETIKYIGLFWYFLLPLGILIYYFLNGRDSKVDIETIPPLFDIPKDGGRTLSPAEVGAILDEKINEVEITSTIIDLAIKGFITIKYNEEKEFIFTKDKKLISNHQTSLLTHEKLLIRTMFDTKNTVGASTLKESFSRFSSKFNNNIYTNLTKRGYFEKNPKKVRNFWLAIGILATFSINIPFGIISLIMAGFMPKKTAKGAKIQQDCLGLKKFLSSQKQQLKFQEENRYLFEELLPYAIALNVTDIWTKRFEHIKNKQNIKWLTDIDLLSFTTLNSLISSLQKTMINITTKVKPSSGFSSEGGRGL